MTHCKVIKPLFYGLLSSALLTISAAQAADENIPRNPLRQAYYGETHMHTAYSLDAFIGGTRQTPDKPPTMPTARPKASLLSSMASPTQYAAPSTLPQ